MLLYLDASALVKRYVTERGSEEVADAIAGAEMVGTVAISRAEVAAALAKAVQMGALKQRDALDALDSFRKDWLDLVRVQVTEGVVSRADALAWEHNLRGYDAVHLAAAAVWQETMGEEITFATFDQPLWSAGVRLGFVPCPDDLSAFLKPPRKER